MYKFPELNKFTFLSFQLHQEVDSKSDTELDVFIDEILKSQGNLVKRLPTPPASPKPLNRRAPRVRSPATATGRKFLDVLTIHNG